MRRRSSEADSATPYEVITRRIIEALDEEMAPWHCTWSTANAPQSIHGHRYRGINALVCCPGLVDFSDPRWITFRQTRKMGGHVRRGEKSTPVVFWKWINKEDVDDTGVRTTKRIPFLRYYHVFNVQQTTLELESLVKNIDREHTPIERAEKIITGYAGGPVVSFDGAGQNYYLPMTDSIHLTEPEQFETAQDYYSTAYHELAHSTGHKSRLNHKGIAKLTRYGNEQYALEELVAEIVASFLRAEAGMDAPQLLDNSAAYCKGWARRFKSDTKMVVHGAAQAQRAADLILGRSYDENK